MTELRSDKEYGQKPLDELIADVFDGKALEIRRNRHLIREMYEQKFAELVEKMPSEDQDTLMVNLQRIGMTVRGVFAEYGARITDFVRNIVVWPMIRTVPDFPKDKYYQIQLARAKAWTGFAGDTVKTATAERLAYRDHFLPSAVIGAEGGALFGTFWGIPAGILIGATEGAKMGLLAGVGGVAVGAGLGAILGGGASLSMRLKDRMIGPPLTYYNLDSFSGIRGGGVSIGQSSSLSTNMSSSSGSYNA